MNIEMDFKRLLFSFEGRLRRRDWWLAAVAIYLCQALLFKLLQPVVLGADAYSVADALNGVVPPLFDWRAKLLAIATTGIFAWPWLALAAKRVHDRDRDARPTLIVLAATAVLGFVPGDLTDAMTGANPLSNTFDWLLFALGLVVTASKIWLFVVIALLRGTPGPNRFGPLSGSNKLSTPATAPPAGRSSSAPPRNPPA